MIRGETLPIVLDFSGQDVDFTSATSIKATIRQGSAKVTKTPTVTDATTLTVNLTQAESLSFSNPSLVFPLEFQCNWLEGGERVSSEISIDRIGDQLYTEVLT